MPKTPESKTVDQSAAVRPLSKNGIISHLAEHVEDLTKKQAGAVLDALVDLACVEAKKTYKDEKGELKSVGFTIPGLGKLVLRDSKERQGRNPKTKEPIIIPARRTVKFKIAKAAKEKIAGPAPAAKKPKAKKA